MNRNNLIIIFALLMICSCRKKSISHESISNNTENIHSLLKSIEETDRKLTKYGYIEAFNKKYPSEINLFETYVLKEQLIELLGRKNYEIFLENTEIQNPIIIVEESYAYTDGNFPNSYELETAAIEIDFITDKISVGILHNGQVLYFTEKDEKKYEYAEGKLKEWLIKAHEKIDPY